MDRLEALSLSDTLSNLPEDTIENASICLSPPSLFRLGRSSHYIRLFERTNITSPTFLSQQSLPMLLGLANRFEEAAINIIKNPEILDKLGRYNQPELNQIPDTLAPITQEQQFNFHAGKHVFDIAVRWKHSQRFASALSECKDEILTRLGPHYSNELFPRPIYSYLPLDW